MLARGRQPLLPLVIALVLVAALLSPVFPSLPTTNAGTEGSGIIDSDTNWTKANSPYIVVSNVLVSEGVTLTIEPGVEVRFNSAKGIQIDDELIARGTEAEPVVFTSNKPSPGTGDWVNILFTDRRICYVY